jgi:hypothetical protein
MVLRRKRSSIVIRRLEVGKAILLVSIGNESVRCDPQWPDRNACAGGFNRIGRRKKPAAVVPSA